MKMKRSVTAVLLIQRAPFPTALQNYRERAALLSCLILTTDKFRSRFLLKKDLKIDPFLLQLFIIFGLSQYIIGN